MKKNILVAFIMIFPLIPHLSHGKEGFNYQLGMGVAVLTKADNLWGGGFSSITSLNRSPRQATELIPFPVFDIRYVKDKGATEFYFNNTSQDEASLALGIKKRFEKSTIDAIGFVNLFTKAWKNPYVLNRDRTQMYDYGCKISFNNIVDTHINLSWKIQRIDISDDLIGEMNRDLRRDGTHYSPEISYTYQIGDRYMLIPGLVYEKGKYTGKSNSFDSYGFSIGVLYIGQDINFISKVFQKNSRFDKVHPIFGKIRQEETFGATAIMNLSNPLGYKGYVLSLGVIAGKTHSNITFFDRYSIIGFTKVGYMF